MRHTSPLPLVVGGGLLGLLLLASASLPGPAVKPALPDPGPLSTHSPLAGHPAIRSRYGWRTDPVYGGRAFHAGIDLPAAVGTPVHCPLDGIVTRVDRDGVDRGEANGNAVFVAAGGYRWCFLHLDRVLVTAGTRVSRGQVLGFSGNTGKSTGPHLHVQVYDAAGNTVDPEQLYPAGTFRNGRAVA